MSTERQVRDGYGLPAQRADIRAWAKSNGHTITAWFSDDGVSGANGIADREGLYQALSALESGKAAGIVFASLDRLARRLTEQEGVLYRIWDSGCRAFSLEDGGEVLEDDPDEPLRTALRQMRGVFAQLDRGLIRQRLRKGRREKAARGLYAGFGSPPFGYRASGGELVPDEREQVVRALVTELRQAGHSYREIAGELERAGHQPKRPGSRWHSTTIQRLLSR